MLDGGPSSCGPSGAGPVAGQQENLSSQSKDSVAVEMLRYLNPRADLEPFVEGLNTPAFVFLSFKGYLIIDCFVLVFTKCPTIALLLEFIGTFTMFN